MILHAHIHELEQRLLQQEIRLDATSLNALLADDFVEFGARGQVWKKADIIADLQNETFAKRVIRNFETRELADGVVLATYVCSSDASNTETGSISLRSSIWRRHQDNWQMAFHQGTWVSA